MIPRQKGAPVSVSIPSRALTSIFDDCDRYDHDETGGRMVGVFRSRPEGILEIEVTGVIEAGPRARRSSSSFFQDGDYQAQVFRRLEASHPEIEHLGNWHTHHVNGYPTLSAGDIETYKRIVNHDKHNPDFFYALLVVARSHRAKGLSRYRIRHFVLFRGDNRVYEIESPNVIISKDPIVWPTKDDCRIEASRGGYSSTVRAKDDTIMPEFFPTFRPYWSKRANTFYWKGHLELINSTSIEIAVPEMCSDIGDERYYYQVIAKNVPEPCTKAWEQFAPREFESATQAVRSLEREMNRVLYHAINQRGC